MAITKVAIIGGSASLDSAVIDALLLARSFDITAIQRQSSTAILPVPSVRVSDELLESELVTVLRGQGALIITLPSEKVGESILLANACVKAGVQRLIPGDFSSGDSADLRAQEVFAGYAAKARVRAHLEHLAGSNEDFSWSSILCGHFFDRNLWNGLLHFNLEDKTAEIFNGGEARWSAYTFARIGGAVVRVLTMEEVTKNRMVYVQSFCISQQDMIASLQRVSGQPWTVSHLDSRKYLERQQEALAKGDQSAIEDVVLLHGIAESNWEKHPNFANEEFGLEGEDLDLVVSKVWKSVQPKAWRLPYT